MTPPRFDDFGPMVTPSAGARQRALAGALAELHREPVVRPWRRAALGVIAAVVTVTAIGCAVVAVMGGVAPDLAAARVPGIALLLVAQVCGLWAALAPRRAIAARATMCAGVAAAFGAGAVLVARASSIPIDSPGWICSLTHFATALVPLTFVVAGLRDAAWSPRRALTAGLALGAAGPIWGEIACERGLAHVVLQHGGAWLAIALACFVVARLLPKRSFAP
jgi:hypothetical protein